MNYPRKIRLKKFNRNFKTNKKTFRKSNKKTYVTKFNKT